MKLVKLIELPYHKEINGDLVVAEGENSVIPFSIKRVFNVRQQKGDIRGKHAHRHCSQLLICTNGAVEVKCDDTRTTEIYVLDKPNFSLFIPPGIWADQKYIEDNIESVYIKLQESELEAKQNNIGRWVNCKS